MRPTPLALGVILCTATTHAQQAYLSSLSAAPGDTVDVHVSSNPSAISVWRTFHFGDNELRLTAPGPFNVPTSTWTSGSYAEVPTHPDFEITDVLSLEAWIRPAVGGNGSFYGILSKYSVSPDETAYMIYLMPDGELSFYLGDTGVFSVNNRTLTANPIPLNTWTHVVATYDGAHKRIYINGQLDVAEPRTGPIFDNDEPVRVASYGGGGNANHRFNGQIDSPAIYNRVLTPAEIAQRFAEQAAYGPGNPGVLPGAVGQWNFGELDGTTLADATGNGHDLTLVNYGSRGVPGPSPRTTPTDSHSIRFSDEDLTDLDWPIAWSFTVPANWESGLYFVRVGAQWIPLIINPAPTNKKRIAVLAATNTWHAYNSWTGNNMYTNHAGGPIAYYVNMRQPNPSVNISNNAGGSFHHLLKAERYLYRWLDGAGYPFDLYTDFDLHRDPTLLDGYDVLILNGHSEYWSHEMVDHTIAFLAQGGSLVNLSGNTMWSLVSFSADMKIIEGRKHPHSAGTIPADERWHSTAGAPLGGTLRCIGRPEHAVIGVGYGVIVGAGNFGYARVLEPKHWAFAGTGLTFNARFGESSANDGGGMFGHESDVVLEPWSPANIEVIARAVYPSGGASSLNISNCQSRSSTGVVQGGDVYYFDHPAGGGVFGIPSIAAGASLIVDDTATRILQNVLDRFLTIPKCKFRNGAGANQIGFTCTTLPVLGTTWQTAITTNPNTLNTFLAMGLGGPHFGFPSLGGEVLIQLAPPPIVLTGAGTHSVGIPGTSSAAGLTFSTQGLRVDDLGGVPTLFLLNAQDLVLGL